MIEDAENEQPKKARGWPKGKARGPRKPATSPVQPQTPPPPAPAPSAPVAPPAPAPAAYEPVDVRGSLVSGKEFALKCSDYNRQNGNYVFISYPLTRGLATVTLLKIVDVAAISITAPEAGLNRLLAPPVPQPPPPPTYQTVAPFTAQSVPAAPAGPQVNFNPYAQAIRDTAATQAARVPNEAGLPMSTISAGEDGRSTVVGATMK